MSIKKLLSVVMAICIAAVASVSITGCSGEKTGKYKVGICQLAQHDALDAATNGFKEALIKILGKDNVEFDLQNAAGDSPTCSTIVNQFVSNNVDLIMANATPALQAAASATGDIPIVATSITDYATALDISNWTGKTGTNITGTADLAPLKDQANMIKELVPSAKKVGILYCSAEPNSKYQSVEISKHLKKLGLQTKEFSFADSNDIASVTTTACSEVDVIYVPTDNMVASNKAIVDNVAGPAKIPVIAGEQGVCEGCGIATLSIDYYDIGYRAGEMAAEILKDGKDPADMEIKFATELTKKYVPERCTALNITVPSDYVAITTK